MAARPVPGATFRRTMLGLRGKETRKTMEKDGENREKYGKFHYKLKFIVFMGISFMNGGSIHAFSTCRGDFDKILYFMSS